MATEFRVSFAPPVKQTPASSAEMAAQQALNDAIRAAFAEAYAEGWSMHMLHIDLEMVIRYERGTRRSDAANIIGGIADQLERLDVYHNDRQLRRIDYEEQPSTDGLDRYSVSVRPWLGHSPATSVTGQ